MSAINEEGAAVFCSDLNELGACYHTGVQCAAGGLDDGDEFIGGAGFEIETSVTGESFNGVVTQCVLDLCALEF
jgi:hypothetical protein